MNREDGEASCIDMGRFFMMKKAREINRAGKAARDFGAFSRSKTSRLRTVGQSGAKWGMIETW